ncbi:MAG: redoxin domain-containing protein [Chloroflexia bacterium]
MGKTEPRNATDLGFDVEIVSGGRAEDSGTASSARTLSPARQAAKSEAHRRRILIAAACALGLAVIAVWAWASNPNSNVPSDAVTRVNDEYIYERDVTREVDLSRLAVDLNKDKNATVPSRANALENLISRMMQVQDAKRAGLSITPAEVDSDIKDRLRSTGLTQAQLEADLAKYNLKLDDMRAFSADVLLVNKYVADVVLKGVTGDEQRQNRYNDWLTGLSQAARIDRLKSAGSGPAPSIGSEAPDFTLRDLSGKEIKLSSLKGRPVMLNFWATWCPPCRSEIPTLVQTYNETHKPGDPYEIVGIATQSDLQTIQAFAKEFGIQFPIVSDTENRITDLYHVLPIPTSFFIDKYGIIRDIQIGPVDRPQLEKWLIN